MSDPIRIESALHEVADPWEGHDVPPAKVDPLIVDPWELLERPGLDERGEFENPWENLPASPIGLDPSIVDPWLDEA